MIKKVKNFGNKTSYKTVKEINCSDKNAITLIALVITIIVLLILAGVTISIVINNGIPKRAEDATKEYTKSSLKEEIEIAIIDARMDDLNIKDNEKIAEKLEDIGAIIIDVDKDHISGEYKDHIFEVDKDGNVTIGDKVSGVKPEIEINILTEGTGLLEVELQVIAKTEEGEIASIEPLNGAVLVKENSNSDKVYKVTKNGTYRFKITGSNKRIAVETVNVNTILVESESLLKAISEINDEGETKVLVDAVSNGGTKETYSLDVIYYKGDLILGETLKNENGNDVTIEGLTLSGTTWTCGKSGDAQKNTVVLKVDGNLTINSEITLTTIGSKGNTPKGMIIYCTKTLTNNGIINMSGKASAAAEQNIYLYKNTNGTHEYIPKLGGVCGAGMVPSGYTDSYGKPGSTSNVPRGCGGGGGFSSFSVSGKSARKWFVLWRWIWR